MLYYVASALLVVGLAGQTLAEPLRKPYQPQLARMSTKNIFGLDRRQVEGYSPTQQLCGVGDTCDEACGKGFKQCASKDSLTHCYNPLKKQTCCPGGTGDSCDDGYFCTADDQGATWCCPDNLSLTECAQRYNLPGPLTSQAPPTSTTTKAATTKDTSTKAPHTSTPEPDTTSTKSKKPETAESTTTVKVVHQGSTSKSEAEGTSTMATDPKQTTTLAIDASTPLISTEAAATQTTLLDSTPSSTPSTPSPTNSVSQGGSGSPGPVNSLVLFIAGALAALV
ncbi:hypothetical protein HD806DRAFT_318974 [Xylariaceae sp. AK1471]|nr:hypothetical protein HD806DRAFT_318974 [Xylariaceae sp. AK1471]